MPIAALPPKIASDKARGAGPGLFRAKLRNAVWRAFSLLRGRNPVGRLHEC